MTSIDALMILGPTASGKTALALNLARKQSVEIISIDSALVYRGMDIGTAKPTKDELAKVPHHLIDILDPRESYSAALFVKDCEQLVKDIRGRGHLPLIVGGTMLYAKALREGLSVLPSSNEGIRAQLEQECRLQGIGSLYAKLTEIDPVTASRLAPADTQRIMRALEVYAISGKPLSEMYCGSKGTSLNILAFGLMPQNRAELHRRIEIRFDQMIELGFLDEVRELMRLEGLTADHPSMRSVGYRQAWGYLREKLAFDAFHLAAVAATRQLAKRQMTWLRSMRDITLLDPMSDDVEKKIEEAAQAASGG